jgi:hypothetical protein
MEMILYVFILQGLVWASSEYFKNSVEPPKFDIPIVQDEFFGELQCIHCYFYSNHFRYKNKIIHLSVYRESTLPTEIQRDFYFRIENKIDAIIDKLKPQIHALLKEDLDITVDNEEVISLQSILIPRSDKTKWEITVDCYGIETYIHLDNDEVISVGLNNYSD